MGLIYENTSTHSTMQVELIHPLQDGLFQTQEQYLPLVNETTISKIGPGEIRTHDLLFTRQAL